MMTLLIGWMNI